MTVDASITDEPRIEQSAIGQSLPRADGKEKVRGEPVFYGDLSLPHMLYGRVLRSRYPHARILRIDISRAAALSGVAKIATHADIPGCKTFGPVVAQPILCENEVNFVGDAVALVAADSAEIAAKAAKLIEVEYEELPAVFCPQEALLPGARLLHETRTDNLAHHFKLRKGNVEEAFAHCDVIVENTYRTQCTEHAYLEVEGAVACTQPDATLTVWLGTPYAFKVRETVAQMLKLPPEDVRVINTYAGGGFGGKSDTGLDTGCRAALLSWLTKRPVKLVYGRDESITSSTKRHPAIIEYKTGATKDGRLKAAEIRVYLNKGAYASVGANMPPAGGVTNKSGYHAAGPYVIPHVRVDVYNVYTNTVPSGAFRGFGVPQVAFAHELQMDEVARRLGMDPVEIRLLNGLEAGSRTASNQLLEYSVGLKESIRRCAEAAGWKQFHAAKARERSGRIRRGMGIGCFMLANSSAVWPEFANATMEVDSTGRILVRTGIQETGQGTRTGLAQVAAQALGIPAEYVLVSKRGDTATDQDSMNTVSSRGTIMGGNATIRAAKEARQTLLEVAADRLGVSPDRVVMDGDQFGCVDNGKIVSLQDVLLFCFKCGRRLLGKGWWCTPEIKLDPETRQGNPYHIFDYGAQVAEVEVDTATGNFEVTRIFSAQDVGKAINPEVVVSQIQGGVVMALGFTTMEEVVVDKGYVVNPSFATFLIPTAADVPRIVPIIVEDPYPNGPFGAKGVGEAATVATTAAVANAIHDAVGVPLPQLPITAERVWKALHANNASVAHAGQGSGLV